MTTCWGVLALVAFLGVTWRACVALGEEDWTVVYVTVFLMLVTGLIAANCITGS